MKIPVSFRTWVDIAITRTFFYQRSGLRGVIMNKKQESCEKLTKIDLELVTFRVFPTDVVCSRILGTDAYSEHAFINIICSRILAANAYSEQASALLFLTQTRLRNTCRTQGLTTDAC
jgi:hypothetical protein